VLEAGAERVEAEPRVPSPMPWWKRPDDASNWVTHVQAKATRIKPSNERNASSLAYLTHRCRMRTYLRHTCRSGRRRRDDIGTRAYNTLLLYAPTVFTCIYTCLDRGRYGTLLFNHLVCKVTLYILSIPVLCLTVETTSTYLLHYDRIAIQSPHVQIIGMLDVLDHLLKIKPHYIPWDLSFLSLFLLCSCC